MMEQTMTSGFNLSLLAALLVVLSAACGQSGGPEDAADAGRGEGLAFDAPRVPDAPDPCPGGTPSGITAEQATREQSAGRTEFAVLFASLRCQGLPDTFEFHVSMTNHSCSIPNYNDDLEQHVRLTTSDGVEVPTGFTFEISSTDGHHPTGALRLAAKSPAGAPLVGCQTQSVTLEVRDIDQEPGQALAFTWDGALLDGVRSCP